MKLLNKIVAISLCILTVCNASGQDIAKAKTILNKVSKKYEGFKDFKADYTQTTIVGKKNLSSKEKGKLYVKKGKFKLETEDQVIFYDGSNLWAYIPEDKQVTVSKFNPATLGFNPAEIFTIYKKDFNYAFIDLVKVEGLDHNLVELTPKDKNKSIFKIKMYINPKTSLVKQVEIFEKNGNKTLMDVTSFNSNAGLSDAFFTFDKTKNPKVEVVDTRK